MKEKAVAHFASILFFVGLLATLGAILEHLVRTHWEAISAALLWTPQDPVQARIRSPRPVSPIRRWSAAS